MHKHWIRKEKSFRSQVEVQTQIGLWSDPVERSPVCSQPKLQGLERSSSALQSGRWSGDGLIRGRFGLKNLIIGGFERTWVLSEATSREIGSDLNLFERTFVWSEATLSAIGSDLNLFERTWVWSEMFSNAIGSDQGPFRGHFFHFFVFFTQRCWLCPEAAIKQRSDQRLI